MIISNTTCLFDRQYQYVRLIELKMKYRVLQDSGQCHIEWLHSEHRSFRVLATVVLINTSIIQFIWWLVAYIWWWTMIVNNGRWFLFK
jgi:hypothetical protein